MEEAITDLNPKGPGTGSGEQDTSTAAGSDEGGPSPIHHDTKAQYEKFWARLMRASVKERSIDPLEPVLVTPSQMVQDLYQRDRLAPATRDTYRAAILWICANHRGEPAYDEAAAKLEELAREAQKAAQELAGADKARQRQKSIPESDLHLLVEELSAQSKRSKWAYRTQYWLLAGLATGLRPVEWGGAHWTDESHTELQVVNAKQKMAAPGFMRKGPRSELAQTRPGADTLRVLTGTPVTRVVPVAPQDRFAVETHLALLREQLEAGMALRDCYERCRRALWRTCGKLWAGKKVYSLYSMRKQYSANQKASVGSKKTAILMGHSREDSPSAAAYGKANQAHAGFKGRRNAASDLFDGQAEQAGGEEPASAAGSSPQAAD